MSVCVFFFLYLLYIIYCIFLLSGTKVNITYGKICTKIRSSILSDYSWAKIRDSRNFTFSLCFFPSQFLLTCSSKRSSFSTFAWFSSKRAFPCYGCPYSCTFNNLFNFIKPYILISVYLCVYILYIIYSKISYKKEVSSHGEPTTVRFGEIRKFSFI